jgi:hypothetical protein
MSPQNKEAKMAKKSGPLRSTIGAKAMAGKPMTRPQDRAFGAPVVIQDKSKDQKATKKR